MKNEAPKVLVLDIETTPLALLGWGLFDQNFSLDQIQAEWSIMSFSAKWLGQARVIYMDTGGRGKANVRKDRKLMKPLRDLLNDADIVIAQNGKKFDMRKINARLIEHGFKPPSPYKVVDTMLEARRYFAFTSQKLAWTSEHLTTVPKDKHKEFPGFELWIECLKDNPRAWKALKVYNARDILATEEVYKKILPWIQSHPNMGVYYSAEKPICPNCGGSHLIKDGYSILQQGKYIRYQCKGCGKYSRGKTLENTLSKRKTQMVG